MTGASKILTVSYGTFSCTLEGFDDPFNTMKAIAEYFRDLAAEDRYFGAEPPTPDAAMLHKIAEREIQRRVEAKIDANGVILRAQQGVTPKVSFPSPTPDAVTQAPVLQPAPALASVAEAAPALESAAARLSRLRAAQSHSAPASAVAMPMDIPAQAYLDAYSDEIEANGADFAPHQPAFPAALPVQDDLEKAAAKEARKAKKAKPEPVAEPVAETPAEPPTPPQSDELLANITKALATPQPAKAAEPKAPSQADAEPDLTAKTLDSLTAAIRETVAGEGDGQDTLAAQAATVQALPLTEVGDLPETIGLGADDLADLDGWMDSDDLPQAQDLSATDLPAHSAPPVEDVSPEAVPEGDHPAAAQIAPDFAAPDTFEDEDLAAALADLPADNLPVPEALAAAVLPEPVAEPVTEPVLARNEAPAAEMTAIQPEPQVQADQPQDSAVAVPAAPSEKIQRARARVIKIRRLDTATDQTVAQSTAQPPAPQPVVAQQTSLNISREAAAQDALTAQDEAELQSELASLEAELSPAQPESRLPESRLPSTDTDDASVNRLLEKTNTELEVPETKRRRSAIAHLKAAVLATVAERRANPNAGAPDTQRMDTFRKDLDQAMRPEGSATDRQADRPAPLVLVSSQRIDRKPANAQPQAKPQTGVQIKPVRPRRVSVAASQTAPAFGEDADSDEVENIFVDPSKQSFAEFAEAVGATSMRDLIEAAGAYCTLVLGRDSFTRPQLFQQISSITGQTDLSREDGLRGFGRLLRDGRMTKTKRGEYVLAESSPILNEARRRAS